MTYRILYSGAYSANLNDHLIHLRRSGVSTFTIDRWFGKLSEFVKGLNEWPERFPIDPVVTKATGRETRKAKFGNYVILYHVDHELQTVTLLGFVHSAMRQER